MRGFPGEAVQPKAVVVDHCEEGVSRVCLTGSSEKVSMVESHKPSGPRWRAWLLWCTSRRQISLKGTLGHEGRCGLREVQERAVI